MPTSARALAFYLPQYFPIPENDEWWGRGFTEWTNVAKARRLFPGHQQPTLPSELGFYDLRVPETRAAQAELAQEHGVEAFVYWHYWFGDGDRILDRPFREVQASGEPGISFCLAWANQTWTGIWHGAQDRVLKQQRYPGVARRASATSPSCSRPSPTPATSRSTGDRCSTSSAPRSFRTRRPSSSGGRPWPARWVCPASTSSRR